MHLRSTLALLLSVFALSGLAVAEDAKPMATINVSQVVNSVGYEVWSQIGMDKEALETIKQLKAQRAELRKRVVNAKDDIELQHVNKDIQFNLSKTQQLQNLAGNGNGGGRSRQDSTTLIKDFLATTYKGKYSLILDNSNQNSGGGNQVLISELKTVDITNEVIAAFKAANE
jgi:TolA-binding protein